MRLSIHTVPTSRANITKQSVSFYMEQREPPISDTALWDKVIRTGCVMRPTYHGCQVKLKSH